MSTMVLGAGYAGVMAANRLAGRGEAVTLVTPHPWFVERIRLHAVAAGRRADARRDLSSLLHPDIDVVLDTAERIDDDTVHLASGTHLAFDALVYAVGSGAPRGNGVHRIVSEPEAERLRAALGAHPDQRVTVVGAGLTGVELAGALVSAGRRVRLIAATEPSRQGPRAHLRNLRRRGVDVQIAHVDAGDRDLALDGDLIVDATGFTAPTLAADSGLPTDHRGALLVDLTLRVVGHPRIFGAGDGVRIDEDSARHIRNGCASALPMGAHAAAAILAQRRREPRPAFAMGYALQCVDLGSSGHVQFVHPDDTERPLALTGRAGALLKEAVCRMTIRWMTQERQHPGRYSWPAPPPEAK